MASIWDSYIAPYFETGGHTGTRPPISYSFTPFSAVISMRTGEVVAVDTDSTYLSVQQIVDAVNLAAQ